MPALGARQCVQAWYVHSPLTCVSAFLWAASKVHTPCAGDCIHLFHVVTHDTARSLECFSRPMEEDLPPEYHQELLVRAFLVSFAGVNMACVCKIELCTAGLPPTYPLFLVIFCCLICFACRCDTGGARAYYDRRALCAAHREGQGASPSASLPSQAAALRGVTSCSGSVTKHLQCNLILGWQ